MVVISDGKGTGKQAEVNEEQQLVVRAITESELEHASSQGRAYVWYSAARDIDATDTMLFVKNTGDTPLILDRMTFIGSDVACTWTIHVGSDTTTPSAAIIITGVNLNPGFSAVAADAVARADETAVADGNIVETVHTQALLIHHHPAGGIILTKNTYIQINQETESDSGSVALFAHFENPS